MKGTNIQKVLRLSFYLITHPYMLPLYFRQSVNRSDSPLSLELPWVSFSAINYLKKHIKPYHSVAEFGGGGSTIFFSRLAASVHCIESHELWTSRIMEKLAEYQITNVTIELHPFDAKDAYGYARSSCLGSLEGKSYDVILIDGYEEDVELRPICFYHSENHVKKNGIIVVDDSWRYPALHEKNRAKASAEFRSIGPCRPGVTTTAIFFY